MKVLWLFCACVLFSGCYKALDIHNDPGQGFKFCRVVKLGLAPPAYPGDTSYPRVYISYNSSGNPVDMLFYNYNTPFYNTDNHFRYDRQGRLTDWLITYVIYYGNNGAQEGAPVVWFRYSYPRKDIVVDSEFAYGDMSLSDPFPPQSSFEGRVTIFHLDQQGRIIETSDGPGGNPGYFSYDHRGNLIRPGVTYDDKLNPYRTNSVWMFLNQDYSVDNPLIDNLGYQIDTFSYSNFNAIGLPQTVNVSGNTRGTNFFYNFQTMTITYDCSCNSSTPLINK